MKRKRKNDEIENDPDEDYIIRIGFLLTLIAVVIIYAFNNIPSDKFRDLMLNESTATPEAKLSCGEISQSGNTVRFTLEYTNSQGETSRQTFNLSWDGTFTQSDCDQITRSVRLGQLGSDLALASDRIADEIASYLSDQGISIQRFNDWIRSYVP